MEAAHPLKSYRERHRPPLSKADLAGVLGVARLTVHRWETGKRRIDRDLLKKVSEKTGIPSRKLRPDLAELMEK
jgi:transcriptional regulator with XRE-family HTH domain